jgi:Glycosyl transferase family 2
MNSLDIETSPRIDVSIVMPCLNEVRCLPACIANATEALRRIEARYGLAGEILIADNGSTDGSQTLARSLGARVEPVNERGYGAALMGGARAAAGRYIIMGDADGSYDFCDSVAMIGELVDGADLCVGSRFAGGIKPGAMPWKNRYIGNPILTGTLNLLFRAGIDDAHCGLRALTKPCFERLGLSGTGMEFASEMIIKAALKECRIAQVPATLSPDLRDRPPHLRPWRDGWRHLRYLLMLSPTWLFAIPAVVMGTFAAAILLQAVIAAILGLGARSAIGNYWVIAAGAMLGVAHITALLAAASHLYGLREGYQRPSRWTAVMARWISLESMLLSGLGLVILGMVTLIGVIGYWSSNNYGMITSVLPAVVGTSLLAIGAQNALGGFMLAIIAGNEAEFLKSMAAASAKNAEQKPQQSAQQPGPLLGSA